MADGSRAASAVRGGSSAGLEEDRLRALTDECEIRDLIIRCARCLVRLRTEGGRRERIHRVIVKLSGGKPGPRLPFGPLHECFQFQAGIGAAPMQVFARAEG